MRDAFGEVDPDEIDVIDLVEPDAAAFGEHTQSDAPTRGGNRRRRIVAAASASVLAVAAVGLAVWSPWTEDDTQSFPDSDAPELTLTERLVFGDPPAELTASSLGLSTEDDARFGFGDAEGYFFAEPGATWDFMHGLSSGTWAGFIAEKADGENAPALEIEDGEPAGTVQGAPALINSIPGGGTEVRFGPVDGWIFSVVSGGMSRTESLAFAQAVGVADGLPTLSNESVMGTMLPIGDITDYEVAVSTMFAAMSPFGLQPGIVAVHYGEFGEDRGGNNPPAHSIATQPVAGDATLTLLQFVLGGEDGHTVHGQPAVIGDGLDNFEVGGQPFSFVAWVEGGRLIVVTGPDDSKETLALAETVRPATDDEWGAVVAVVRDPFVPDDFPVEIDLSDPVTLYEDVDPATGDTFSFKAQFDNGTLTTCTEVMSGDGGSGECGTEAGNDELPILWTGTRTDRQIVLAMVDRVAEDAELRITLADGTVDVFPLVDVSPLLPGPAVATLLPDGHGAVELWIGAKIVATL